jgi:hypothetical protein
MPFVAIGVVCTVEKVRRYKSKDTGNPKVKNQAEVSNECEPMDEPQVIPMHGTTVP